MSPASIDTRLVFGHLPGRVGLERMRRDRGRVCDLAGAIRSPARAPSTFSREFQSCFAIPLRPASRAALAGASLLTLALGLGAFPQWRAAWPVGQEDEVTLDDFTATSKDGAVMTIKHADFKGTNLSKEEIEKLLTPDTSSEDETGADAKAESRRNVDSADRYRAQERRRNPYSRRFRQGHRCRQGRQIRASPASMAAGRTRTAPVSIKAGALIMENADLADALGAAKDPKQISPLTHLGHLSWEGIDFTVPGQGCRPGQDRSTSRWVRSKSATTTMARCSQRWRDHAERLVDRAVERIGIRQ